jgi:hypothetical protein
VRTPSSFGATANDRLAPALALIDGVLQECADPVVVRIGAVDDLKNFTEKYASGCRADWQDLSKVIQRLEALVRLRLTDAELRDFMLGQLASWVVEVYRGYVNPRNETPSSTVAQG